MWTYHFDRESNVLDYPGHATPDYRIMAYWINEAGVRIGFFGHAKGIAIFTYKFQNVNFIFNVLRSPGQIPDIPADRTLGPICRVFIPHDHPIHLGTPYGQFEVGTIKDFLLQYKDPRYPSPVAIEKVEFSQPEEFYNNSYNEDSNG